MGRRQAERWSFIMQMCEEAFITLYKGRFASMELRGNELTYWLNMYYVPIF